MRSIADEVGAYLHADICHLAGMIVAGQLSNPLPYADVLMFTTHKTMMGPRGAVIITKCADIAHKIDNAIFPGLQGGPHVNSIAGIAQLFEMVLQNRDAFCQLQQKVISNSAHLASELTKAGLTLEYGGTNTHLVLLDLKPLKLNGGGFHDGETAARLLENVGIVCNKNTLPGDKSSTDATGLRFGTPWLTQRGVEPAQLTKLAQITASLLSSATAFKVWAPSGDERARARVPYEKLVEARAAVKEIARALPFPKRGPEVAAAPLRTISGLSGLLVRGEKAGLGLGQALSCNVNDLKVGEGQRARLAMPDGSVVDDVYVTNLGWKPDAAGVANGQERYAIFAKADRAEKVRGWLEALSDGYVLLDKSDPYMKVWPALMLCFCGVCRLYGGVWCMYMLFTCQVDGPFVVEPLVGDHHFDAAVKAKDVAPAIEPAKPFFVGQDAMKVTSAPLPTWQYTPQTGMKKTVLNAWHRANKGKMVPFGGWDMPVEYPGGIFLEHAAVRAAAGLFDVSHMSALEVSGPNSLVFLETMFANAASRLVDDEAQYSYMLRETGKALDDLYVYRINREKFMVVVNAGNFEQDWSWLTAVNEGRVCVDLKRPGTRVPPVKLVDLRTAGKDSLLDLAFQGPLTLPILCSLAANDEERAVLKAGKLNDIHHIHVGGIPVRAARTGYTGEEMCFELFVHPDQTVELWEMLLDKGKAQGVRAIGLGARDSLRTEAGFPLFGHELEGPCDLSLTEADYGFVSRFHRPYYIGRDAYISRLSPRNKRLVRVTGQGRRMIRGGHAILDHAGKAVGSVTSSAFVDEEYNFFALAAVDNKFNPAAGSTIRAYRTTPEKVDATLDVGKTVGVSVLSRFPTAAEKAGWKTLYAPFLAKSSV